MSSVIADRQSRARPPDALLWITCVVLASPVALFVVTWCTAWIAVPAVLTLLWAVGCLPDAAGGAERRSRASSILFALGLGSVGFCISGAGGVGPQGFDQIKHDSVLADLIFHSWPVLFSSEQPLVYYVGYYILPALIGKIGGWQFANVILALQTWVLYVLAALWVTRVGGRHPKATLLLFAFFWVSIRSAIGSCTANGVTIRGGPGYSSPTRPSC
jgi:hypothetical protein